MGGVVKPVVKCPHCKGGRVAWSADCQRCGGTGRLDEAQLTRWIGVLREEIPLAEARAVRLVESLATAEVLLDEVRAKATTK